MPERVSIGRILKPFGVKGDVRVQSLTDVPGRFESLHEVTIVTRSGQSVHTKVTRVRKDRDSYVVGFDLFSSPEQVGSFRGALIQIPMEPLAPPAEDLYYEFQLIGMAVVDEAGREVGTIEDIIETPSHPVLVACANGREQLIPGTKQVVVSVDVDGGRMVVRRSGVMNEHDAM